MIKIFMALMIINMSIEKGLNKVLTNWYIYDILYLS